MKLDTFTLMVVGMLLCSTVATLIAVTLPRMPAQDRRSMRVWVIGLALQPLAWTVFSIRGNQHDVGLTMLANLLLILGFMELARAVRIFLGVNERRAALHGLAVGLTLVIGLSAAVVQSFSLLVMLNAAGVSLALMMMLQPLLGRLREAGPPERLLALFAAAGMMVLFARFVEHWLRPQVGGGFMLPSTADSIAVLYAAFAPIVVSFAFMLMQQERANTRLEQLATTDGLTALLNRRAFEERARRWIGGALRDGPVLSLLLLDLDHFKRINDAHGHESGDRALRQAARQLQAAVGSGELAARIGGEEFALLVQSPLDEACRRAETIRRNFEEHPLVTAKGEATPLRCSVGVAAMDAGHRDLEAMMRAADQALYRAKVAGRNRVSAAAGTPVAAAIA